MYYVVINALRVPQSRNTAHTQTTCIRQFQEIKCINSNKYSYTLTSYYYCSQDKRSSMQSYNYLVCTNLSLVKVSKTVVKPYLTA